MSKQAVAGKLQQHMVFRSKGPAKIGARPFLTIIFKSKSELGLFLLIKRHMYLKIS